jgi:spermidine/putrescine transport system permease protein
MRNKVLSAPYLFWMVLFTVVPLILVAYYALTGADGGFTLKNVSDVRQFSGVIFRSVWLAVIATLICLVMAYPLAYSMSRLRPQMQRVALLMVMLPMWINFLLRTYAWMTLLENTGLINQLLGLLGIGPLQLINTQGAVVLGMVYNYVPFMILPLYSVMTKIDQGLIHAAQDLGSNTLGVFVNVVLPLSMPGITTGITMVFVPAVSTFAISRMLGGGQNLMIGDLIELQFLGTSYNPNLGSAISMVLMVLVLLLMSAMNQYADEEKEGMII